MSPDDGHVDAAGHRGVGEELLPQARRRFVDPVGRVGVDALEDVDQIHKGTDPEQLAGCSEAVDDPHVACARFRPGKQPVLLPRPDAAQCALDTIGIDRHQRVVEEHLEGLPAFDGAVDRPTDRVLRRRRRIPERLRTP